MNWDLKDGLADSLVAAAPYGGPIGRHTLTHTTVRQLDDTRDILLFVLARVRAWQPS